MFAETGETESLDRENVTNKFLDVFTAPPLETGAGVTETKIFLDGKHSKVGTQVIGKCQTLVFFYYFPGVSDDQDRSISRLVCWAG